MSIRLRIFNFPPILTNVDVREFLHIFGLQPACLFRRRACHGAIVNVANEPEARLVISRLHQLLIHTHRIKVEYSDKKQELSVVEASESIIDAKVKRKAFVDIQEGQASLNYAGFPPPYVLYRYPKHSPTVLNNIANELASNTSFYYQVLHLMNKMNLRVPFESPPVSKHDTNSEGLTCLPHASSGEESELESDDGMNESKRIKLSRDQRPIPRTMKVLHYNQNITNFQNVGKQQSKKKNIQIHISGESLNTTVPPDEVNSTTSSKPIESQPNEADPITLSDILSNRIPDEQQKSLNVFQNYSPGDPTNKLYIKNLAKTVTEQDLHNLINIFFDNDHPCSINVKLMKTGRMKGQAFISFVPVKEGEPSSGEMKKYIAHALSAINGYILKDKPMVVSYAKSS